MKKAKTKQLDAEQGDMLPEYDFTGMKGVRGKYYKAYRKGYSVKIHKADGTTVVQYSKSIRNTGKHWTSTDVKNLRELSRENTPTRVIGLKLGRTKDAVRAKASEKGVSLKPTNRSPTGRNDPQITKSS